MKSCFTTAALCLGVATCLLAPTAVAAPEAKPGTGKPLTSAHPGYTLEQARPADFTKPDEEGQPRPGIGALAFMPDGKLAVTTFLPENKGIMKQEPTGKLYILENATAKDPSKIVVKEITDQLYEPLGMYYLDGALYISERNRVSKWTDTDDDGLPDKGSTFASGWISDNYHHFSFGLPYQDGKFYLTLSTNITFKIHIEEENIEGELHALNGPNPPLRGCLLEIDAETGDFKVISGGLRTPNGVSLGPEGTVLIPDNQGAWKPASGIYVGEQGAFFGHYNNTTATSDFYPDGGTPATFSDKPVTPPAIWLPQGEASNSPTEMVTIPEGHPHAGQMLMGELTLGGLKRVQMEKVDGQWQGAVYRHSHGFEAGLNRLEWGPDNCLYVGGMGAGRGNWGWRNQTFGLQRLAPTGETAFEFASIHATADGFEVKLTKPAKAEDLQNPEHWDLEAWTYEPTRGYGGPKKEVHKPEITSITAAEDGKSVRLVMPELKSNFVYRFRTDVASAQGEALWSGEAWYTLHKQPSE